MTSGSDFACDTTATAGFGGETLVARRCPACGAARRRAEARFCHTCGRRLAGDESYAPADSLRASYHAQQQVTPASRVVRRGRRFGEGKGKHALARLPFIPRHNRLAAFALASIVYAVIPLLGILFCLPAILLGGWGAFVAPLGKRSFAAGEQDGRRAARFSFYAGLILLSLQLLLWWALRRAPQLAGMM